MTHITSDIYSRSTKQKRHAAFISLLGTTIEYYDYALYGFCASILASTFFNEADKVVGLIKAFGVFAAGSFAKPLGSLIFGTIGDKLGRRPALRWSMVGIAVPMTVITLCPPYAQWGWVDAFLLILSRIVQGIFISGESDGARIFIFESFHHNRPYLTNCFVGISCYVGIFIASQVSTFCHAHAADDLWRLPFLAGGFLGLIMLILRTKLIESDEFMRYKNKPTSSRSSFYWRGILATVLLCGSVGGSYHLFFVYLPTYLSSVLNLISSSQAHTLTTSSLSIYIPCLVLTALLADRFGGMKIILIGAISSLGLFPFLMNETLFTTHPMLIIGCLSVAFALLHGPGFVLLMEQFDVAHRYRSVSIGHSVGSMLFSGSAPMVSVFLWQLFQSSQSIAYHLMGLVIMGVVGILLIGPAWRTLINDVKEPTEGHSPSALP